MTEPTIEQQQLLEQLLNDHQAGQYVLPPLQPDTSWLEQTWNQLKDSLGELLRRIFNPDKVLTDIFTKEHLLLLFNAVMFALICVAVLLIVRFVFRKYRTLTVPPKTAEPGLQTKVSALQERITAAVQSGDWKLAMRLRWKLFLEQTRQRPDRSPREWSLETAHAFPENLSVDWQYLNMFGPEPAEEQGFQNFAAYLRTMERPGDRNRA